MQIESAFFLFCFFPLLALLYPLCRKEKRGNWILLIAGLVFYSFGSLQGLLILIASAAVNYFLGKEIAKGYTFLCTVGVVFNLAVLGFYKYWNFLLGDLLGLPQLSLDLAVPLGISFFTFKAVSYLIDVKRNPESRADKFPDFLLYLSFFPQILAGPLTRFPQFRAQLKEREFGRFGTGLRRVIVGLSKKLLLAGTLSEITSVVFPLGKSVLDARLAWLGAIAYMLEIYFDFSGYSDVAIGLGQMFGFDTPENFAHPYTAVSVSDFWRKWHISLSSWFKDYLYIPLGGNRKGRFRTALNKFLVFAVCGLWHGAAWTFVVWGAWHGLLTALESLHPIRGKKVWSRWLGRLYALLAVCVGFVFFRAESLTQGWQILTAMVTGFRFTEAGTVVLHWILNGKTVLVLALGVLLSAPVGSLLRKNRTVCRVWEPLAYLGCLILFLLCVMKIAAGGFAPFIYAQF